MAAPLSTLCGKYIEVSCPHSHVALVELTRKPVNAFNEEYWNEYGHVFDKISQEPDVRVVVLASGLSAGIDLSALASLDAYEKEPPRRAIQSKGFISAFQNSISATERCPYPVILAVHGVAFGLSLDIATARDILYAASDAVFSIKEVDIGLAADISALARLPKVAGNQSVENELAYTTRNFSAAEVEKLGLVSLVVPGSRAEVLAAALETARVIARKSPVAVLGTKHLLLHARDHAVQ